jgi:hypothetical protein
MTKRSATEDTEDTSSVFSVVNNSCGSGDWR